MGQTNTADTTIDRDFERALEDVDSALTAVRQGVAGPYTDLFSNADDVTLFGAWGPIEQGHERLAETFRWVVSRFGPEGGNYQDIRTIHRSGDLAVTVGFERGPAQVDGGPVREMVIRVTHVLRYEDGAWRLVHRHADFPPEDQRLR
jgi:ketosteroid isomerase-like protein